MLRGNTLTAVVFCVVASVALSGCSQTIYPRLPSLNTNGVGSLLSPTEQQEEIKDLASEQKSHGDEAAAEIERR